MNNRSPLILITALVALGLAFLCAQKLRVTKNQINPALEKGVVAPFFLGFNKFCADLAWMQSLQHRGSIDKLNDDLAEILYRRSDKMTSLDPFFYDAYAQAALEIGYLKPDRAIQLLEKAMSSGKCHDWNIPFRAGWVAAYWKEDPTQAVKYYEQAKLMPGVPSHVDRLILYQKGKLAKNDPEAILQLWCNYIRGMNPNAQGQQQKGPFISRLDPFDTQLAFRKITELADKAIADLKELQAKTKDPGIEKRIAYIQQLVTDATTAADSGVTTSVGAANNLVKVTAQKSNLLEPRPGRKGMTLQNNGKKPVYIKLGYGASKSSYGYILQPNGGDFSAHGYDDVVTAVCPDGESEVAIIEIF